MPQSRHFFCVKSMYVHKSIFFITINFIRIKIKCVKCVKKFFYNKNIFKSYSYSFRRKLHGNVGNKKKITCYTYLIIIKILKHIYIRVYTHFMFLLLVFFFCRKNSFLFQYICCI